MDAGRPHPDPRNRDQTLIRVGLLHEEQREDAEGLPVGELFVSRVRCSPL
jgi:hypothetical protein